MLEEYRALIGDIYTAIFWPCILISFYFCKDANIRWTIFILAGYSLFAQAVVKVILPLGLDGYVFHCIQIVVHIYLIKSLIIFRPLFSRRVGGLLAKIPIFGSIIGVVLPAQYPVKFYMAELAIRRVCYAFVLSHSLVVCHYIMFYSGALDSGGLYEVMGIYQLALFDLAIAVHSVGLSLELLLLISLIIAGRKNRLTIKA